MEEEMKDLVLIRDLMDPLPSEEDFQNLSDQILNITFTKRKDCFKGNFPYKPFQEMAIIRDLAINE